MANFWRKIQEIFTTIWKSLTITSKMIAGGIIVILLSLVARSTSHPALAPATPGAEQLSERHPSIGEALPPDVQGLKIGATVEPGKVAGDQTGSQVTNQTTPGSPEKVAPKTGVDTSRPLLEEDTLPQRRLLSQVQ